jgi:hypothetical protein
MNFSEAKDETLLALHASVRRQDADSQSGSRSRVVGKSTKQYADGLREEMARAAAGTSIANVMKITVFLKNVNEDQGKRSSQRSFGACKPASTLIGIAEFTIPGMLIEVEAVAGLPKSHIATLRLPRIARLLGPCAAESRPLRRSDLR